MSRQPPLGELQQQVKLDDVLSSQAKDYDCLSCRVMGSAVFTGLGIYSYASGMSQLRKREQEILQSGTKFGLGARKASIFVTSAALVGLGIYRFKY